MRESTEIPNKIFKAVELILSGIKREKYTKEMGWVIQIKMG